MKLKKSILVIISAMTLLCSNFTSVFASDKAKDTTVNITADLSNSNYTKIVSKIFEDPDVSTVNVIDPTLEVDDFKENIGIAPYKYTYSVIKITSNKGMILKQKAGTGSASRATGCTYKRTYTYK